MQSWGSCEWSCVYTQGGKKQMFTKIVSGWKIWQGNITDITMRNIMIYSTFTDDSTVLENCTDCWHKIYS